MANSPTFEPATVGWAPVTHDNASSYVWHVYRIDGYGDEGWPICEDAPTVDKEEMIASGILEEEPPENGDLCPVCEDGIEYDPSGPVAEPS